MSGIKILWVLPALSVSPNPLWHSSPREDRDSFSICLLGLIECIVFVCHRALLHILTTFSEQFNLKQFCTSAGYLK